MKSFDFLSDARHDMERSGAFLVPLNRPVLTGQDLNVMNVIVGRLADNCLGPIRPRPVRQPLGRWVYLWNATYVTNEADGDYIGYVITSAPITVGTFVRGAPFEYHSAEDVLKTMDEMHIFAGGES